MVHDLNAGNAGAFQPVLPVHARVSTSVCMEPQTGAEFADRVQGRLDRLGLSPEDASRQAGLPAGFVGQLLEGKQSPPRGQRLVRLAEALSVSVGYLVGLDPDAEVPREYLEEEQGDLGLLAGDEEALLRAYRRLDVPSRAALLQIILKMSPEPEMNERRPHQLRK